MHNNDLGVVQRGGEEEEGKKGEGKGEERLGESEEEMEKGRCAPLQKEREEIERGKGLWLMVGCISGELVGGRGVAQGSG